MKSDQAAKRPGKSNRRTPKHVAVKQSDGSYLIYEVEPCGRRKRIGRHIPVDFAEAPELKARSARRKKAAST